VVLIPDTTAAGLNFRLLKSWFSSVDGTRWEEPEEDKPSVYARLLGKGAGQATIACFREQFGKASLARQEEAVKTARELVRSGRLESALSAYRRALERQPLNWMLMNEVAGLLASVSGAPAAGIEMARAALELNPNCSAELWDTLGNGLYACGRLPEARLAYLRALGINPDDVQARYNLAFVHTDAGEYAEALVRIAEALALDKGHHFREVLLRKQTEILTREDQQWQQQFRLMANRVSHRLSPESL
jgi:tetratricopeptide (TPR) repeat protein